MAETLEVLPGTPKIGAGSCPPSRKGPPFLILCRYDINGPRPSNGHKYNKYKIVSVYWWLYVLSNTQATLKVKFKKKSSNNDAELKKSVAYIKKRVSR